MKKDLWFKKKKYSWGWTPMNLKGWIVILVYVLGVSLYPLLHREDKESFSITVFLIIAFVLTAVLIGVCYLKGEKPEWSWGDKKKF